MIWRIIFCSLVSLCLFSRVVQGQINHQVTFSSNIEIPEEVLDDGETYARVIIPGTLLMDSIGYPSLPVKYIKLIVPANASNFNVVVNITEKQKHELKYKVEPLQKPVPIGFSNKPDFVKPYKKIYNSNEPYPLKLAEIVETGYFRGNHLITIAVFPCQYFPKKDELDFFETIDFTVHYRENGTKNKNLVKGQENSKHKRILESIIENPFDIDKFSTTGESTDLNTVPIQTVTSTLKSTVANGITADCDYVVVTSQELAPEFNEFVAWKRRKGIKIELVTIEEIYANYTGDNISGINDNAGKLRQFLAEAYDNGNGIEYALLGGDNTILPFRYGYDYCDVCPSSKCDQPEDSVNYIIPTDLYFADFDGDWEADADGRYGEPCDAVDFNPDIYVGRVMVSNIDEVKNWKNKLLSYELNPGNGDYSYLTKAFFTQCDQLQRDDAARDVLNSATWINDTVIFEEQGGHFTSFTPNFPKGSDIINEFNNHYGFCSFMAHGKPIMIHVATPEHGSCLDIGRYKLKSAENISTWCEANNTENGFNNMTNTNYPSIYYSISCETMPFDNFETQAENRNMGETYTCISNGGGPTYIGNTRYGYVYSSPMLFAEFVNLISNGTSFNLGIAEATSKQNYNNRYLRFSHNLLGCPETEIWTAIPSDFTNAQVSPSGNNQVMVFTNVPGSTVCIMSALDNGESYHEIHENVSYTTFYYVPESYNVTITKHNYIPYTKDPDAIYLQNETISGNRYIYGNYFYAGENVTTQKPQGPVVIQNGANVIFDAENDVSLEGGFEVLAGGYLEVK